MHDVDRTCKAGCVPAKPRLQGRGAFFVPMTLVRERSVTLAICQIIELLFNSCTGSRAGSRSACLDSVTLASEIHFEKFREWTHVSRLWPRHRQIQARRPSARLCSTSRSLKLRQVGLP